MSIDVQIAALIAALNANTEALKAAGGSAPAATTEKATKAKAEKTKDETPKITQEQVNAALIKIKDDFGMPEAKKIITDVGGVEKMAEIKPAEYQAVYDAAVAKHAELSAGGSSEDDDGM